MTDGKYKIIFASGDRNVEISPEGMCRLVEGGVTGFECPPFDVTIKPYSTVPGGYAEKRRFAERELSLTFEIEKSADSDVRRKIISMMDPSEECLLDVTFSGIRRLINVIPADEAKFIRDTFFTPTEVTLKFISPDVFFYAPEATKIVFRDPVPLLTFPLNFMSGAGVASGIYRTTESAAVSNDGDGECGISVRITANGGTVVHPGICRDGLFVKCPLTLHSGDTLEIDTRSGRKNIYLNGERRFSFDKNSSFFSIPRGMSQISVCADSGMEYISAELSFTPIYYGV